MLAFKPSGIISHVGRLAWFPPDTLFPPSLLGCCHVAEPPLQPCPFSAPFNLLPCNLPAFPIPYLSLRFFDADCSGYLSFDEFLVGLRGKLNPRRQEMVDLAFKVSPSPQPPPSLGAAQR